MTFTATLADELLLLAYGDAGGRPPRGSYLDLGLAGAVLTELALAGRIDVTGPRGKVAVVDATPTGDRLVDDVLARIVGETRPRSAKWWVQKVRKGLRPRVLHRLVAAEILSRQESRVLGIFPVVRFPAAVAKSSLGPRADARDRIAAAVLDGREASPRTAALVGLVRAAVLRKAALPGSPRRSTDRRMAELSGGHWVAEAVRRAVVDEQSVAAGAGSAAVVASGAASF